MKWYLENADIVAGFSLILMIAFWLASVIAAIIGFPMLAAVNGIACLVMIGVMLISMVVCG